MCSREELKQLLYELIFRVDQVAYLGARTQFNEECNNLNSQRYAGCPERIPFGNGNDRFEKILRFQKAYIRYFVFASDPYTEFIVPLTSSPLALFITNILSRDGQSPAAYHTSRTIIEFLQITQSHVAKKLLMYYKTDLVKVIKDLRLPYNIEVLEKIRRDCYHQHFSDPNSLQNNQVHQIAQEAHAIFFQQIPKPSHYQTMEYPMIEHSTIQHEEYMFSDVYQLPIQDSNISIREPGIPDQIVNYTPIAHTIPAQNASGYIYDGDSATPFLIIVAPASPINNVPVESNEIQPSAQVVEIPLETEVRNDIMTMDISKADSVNSITGTASNASQISNHQLCAGCGKPIQDRYLLKALDMLWHEDCLKCGCCDCRLGEVGSTLYTKGNLMLCKRDYLRLFGNTGMCAACNKVIPAFEMVMRARNNVYHLECFACQQCNHRFCVGDRFYLCENKILCEYDYEERLVFASIGSHPMMKRHANAVAHNPPPPYTKNNAGNMTNGNGPLGNNGVSQMQQQVMAMDQTQSPHQHQHQQQQQQQQQHIQQSKMQHDDHNNNNNNNHGPTNGTSCGISANQFNAPLMKIPHSA